MIKKIADDGIGTQNHGIIKVKKIDARIEALIEAVTIEAIVMMAVVIAGVIMNMIERIVGIIEAVTHRNIVTIRNLIVIICHR